MRRIRPVDQFSTAEFAGSISLQRDGYSQMPTGTHTVFFGMIGKYSIHECKKSMIPERVRISLQHVCLLKVNQWLDSLVDAMRPYNNCTTDCRPVHELKRGMA